METPICKLGLKLEGSPLEPFVEQMYQELADKGLHKFHPAVLPQRRVGLSVGRAGDWHSVLPRRPAAL